MDEISGERKTDHLCYTFDHATQTSRFSIPLGWKIEGKADSFIRHKGQIASSQREVCRACSTRSPSTGTCLSWFVGKPIT
jgi:hypothetical protein